MKRFNPKIGEKAGDVAYWTGSEIKTIDYKLFSKRLGTPIGVVVVPKGFAPDDKARIVSLYGCDENGNKVNSDIGMTWGLYGVDTILKNYTVFPTTDNNGSTTTGSNTSGYLPSDKLTGVTSYVDPQAKYKDGATMIPSPYLGEEPNPEYYKMLEGNNLLSDFNGLNNTQTLVSLGSDYTAANAAWKYKDGYSNLQWYLPGMAELGYIMVRFNEINNTINSLGGFAVAGYNLFWSSSEYSNSLAYLLYTNDGYINSSYKNNNYSVRPFATID